MKAYNRKCGISKFLPNYIVLLRNEIVLKLDSLETYVSSQMDLYTLFPDITYLPIKLQYFLNIFFRIKSCQRQGGGITEFQKSTLEFYMHISIFRSPETFLVKNIPLRFFFERLMFVQIFLKKSPNCMRKKSQ